MTPGRPFSGDHALIPLTIEIADTDTGEVHSQEASVTEAQLAAIDAALTERPRLSDEQIGTMIHDALTGA